MLASPLSTRGVMTQFEAPSFASGVYLHDGHEVHQLRTSLSLGAMSRQRETAMQFCGRAVSSGIWPQL
jgi:hypothetical protein